jgi:hypothetical protein
MNERIRELIREAESTTNEGIGFEGQENLDMLMERFAELIVKECANELKKWKDEPFPFDEDFAARLITDHFGFGHNV